MATQGKKEIPPDPCPLCYLQSGVTETLQYKPGSRFSHFCNRGHEYPEREQLGQLMLEANAKMRAAIPPAPQARVIIAEGDLTAVEDGKPIKTPVISTEVTVEPAPAYQDKGIHISPIDFARLSSILGHFTDSSSLFGAVFALNQQLAEAREMIQRQQAAWQASEMTKIGGDAQVQILIPERHVGPLNDIAMANGMDITRYLNARVEDGLDNFWFY